MSTSTRPQRPPLSTVAANEARRLAHDPNVACVGIGLKLVRGKPTLQASLQYHVRTKVSGDAAIRALDSEPIPTEVDGYTTDVIPWTMDRRAACPGSKSPTGDRGSARENPLVGGTSTTVLGDFHSFPTGYGTLGGLCFDTATGAAMALSNAHVYGDDIGNDAIQPWLPTSEYLEATVEYLFCGGPLAHLFFWTAPSPLTSILTAAAAGAWIAAIASDAEDPSRWGQRTGALPPPGATTDRERVHIEAEVPHLPFPGRHWRAPTGWQYTRNTSAGATTAFIDDDRPNEHVLVGKRVFTDRDAYRPGDRVTICAQLWTRAGVEPIEHFVVATCYPLADPSRSVRRVLVPGAACGRADELLERRRDPTCVHGFTPQVKGLAQMCFPIVEAPFILSSRGGTTTLLAPGAPGNPSGVAALRLPSHERLDITCPPSTHVEVDVFHHHKAVRATAISANGSKCDQAVTNDQPGTRQTLVLSGPEIVRISVEGGGGEGYLAGICVDKRMIDARRWKAAARYYTGSLDLSLREPVGRWAVVVVAQTLDDTPTGGDPVAAARRLSGLVDSANVVETGECACTVLVDHTFDVV